MRGLWLLLRLLDDQLVCSFIYSYICPWYVGFLLVLLVGFDFLAFFEVKRVFISGLFPPLSPPRPSLAPLGERGELVFELLE